MITVEGVSYIGSTVVSKTIRLGSIPSTPAKETSKIILLVFFIFFYNIKICEFIQREQMFE